MGKSLRQLDPAGRREWLSTQGHQPMPDLSEETADKMTEHYIGNYSVPVGLVKGLRVNGTTRIIPLATEEPSVVAALNKASKLLGNLEAASEGRVLSGEIVWQTEDPQALVRALSSVQDLLAIWVTETVPSLIRRGGGLRDTNIRIIESYVVLMIYVDVCDSMGANRINTILEALAARLEATCGRALLRILSNESLGMLAHASFRIPVQKLPEGMQTAQRIVAATTFAKLDQARAITHNKGILNGIMGVALVSGNDTRALAVAMDAFASKDGRVQPLTDYWIEDDCLVGQFRAPLPVATVGGTLQIQPQARWALSLMGVDDAQTFMCILAAVGLAQNFAALYALVRQGIQQGHMRLQARALALDVGATDQEADQLAERLSHQSRIDRETALHILQTMRDDHA